MKKSHSLVLTLMIGFFSCVPPAAWAEMGQHHDEGSHEYHGGQHHNMEKNAHLTGEDAIFENYFAIHSALAADSMDGVSAKAMAMAKAVEGKHGEAMKGGHSHGAGMHVLMNGIVRAAKSLSEQKDIDSAREKFGKLSEKMIEYQEKLGDKGNSKAHVFVCDMAKKSWLQKDDDLRNPYYGAKMLTCGRKIQ